jgi:hypothetical protein
LEEKEVESQDKKEEAEAKEIENKGQERNRLPKPFTTARLAVERTLGTGTAACAQLCKGAPCMLIRIGLR